MGRFAALSAAYAVPPQLLVLYLNTVSYALCYMMQTPVLPYLTKALGADLQSYGVLMTVFAVVQFVGGLLAGPILDAHGARLVLLASYGSSAVCYALTGAAGSMPLLYLSRLPTLLQHAVLATRAAVAEASSEADRARLLGYVGLAYGVGMAAGPALGGVLSGVSLRLPAWVAAAGSLASVASIALSVPRTRSKRSANAEADAPEGAAQPLQRRLTVSDLGRVSLLPGVPSLLAVKALAGFAAAVFHSAFPIIVGSRFALEARGAGLLLSYTGVLGIVAQGFVIQWATARADDGRIVRVCATAMLAAFLALAAASTVAQLCALLVPLVVAATVLATVNTAQLTKAAPDDLGTVVALDMSVGSGVRCVTIPIEFRVFLSPAHAEPVWRIADRFICRLQHHQPHGGDLCAVAAGLQLGGRHRRGHHGRAGAALPRGRRGRRAGGCLSRAKAPLAGSGAPLLHANVNIHGPSHLRRALRATEGHAAFARFASPQPERSQIAAAALTEAAAVGRRAALLGAARARPRCRPPWRRRSRRTALWAVCRYAAPPRRLAGCGHRAHGAPLRCAPAAHASRSGLRVIAARRA
jgi:OCT family organic cation transporter-like MFS transporter 18